MPPILDGKLSVTIAAILQSNVHLPDKLPSPPKDAKPFIRRTPRVQSPVSTTSKYLIGIAPRHTLNANMAVRQFLFGQVFREINDIT